MEAKQFKGKRVLVVAQHFWPEHFRINDIVQGFVEDGIEVDVLCGLPNYPAGEWYEGYRYTGPRRERYAGAEVFRAGEIRRKGNTNLRIFLNYASFPFFALFSIPRLRKRHYDAVFCYETSPVLMIYPAIVAARRHKAPLTTYVLDLWPENLYPYLPIKSKFLRSVVQYVSDWHYRRCNKLIAMTDGQAARLAQVTEGSKHLSRIVTIPQYCEDFYAQEVQDEELARRFAGKFNILFAGNISPLQDLSNLVQAMRIVKDKTQAPVQVLIVGDGMSRQELEKEVSDAGLSDCFVFCGRCAPDEIPKWTGVADALFAGLADSANLGLTVPAKITSYFAAGRPMLVAANDEAARASLESGAALVSPAADSQALAENILELVGHSSQKRQEMGENGRRCYRKQYSRDLLLGKIQEVVLGE